MDTHSAVILAQFVTVTELVTVKETVTEFVTVTETVTEDTHSAVRDSVRVAQVSVAP